MDQHIDHLREVLSRLKKAGLTVNPSKVNFAVKQFSFLGHIVSACLLYTSIAQIKNFAF